MVDDNLHMEALIYNQLLEHYQLKNLEELYEHYEATEDQLLDHILILNKCMQKVKIRGEFKNV